MHHSFAFWPGRAKGWVLDRALRFTRERLLERQEPALFCRLHQLAAELYTGWYREYPKTKETWEPEAEYHREQVKLFESRAAGISK